LKLSEPEAIGRQRSRRILSHQIERIVAKDMPVARLVALPRQHRIARHAERPAPEILIGQLGELLPKHHRHLLHHIVRILLTVTLTPAMSGSLGGRRDCWMAAASSNSRLSTLERMASSS